MSSSTHSISILTRYYPLKALNGSENTRNKYFYVRETNGICNENTIFTQTRSGEKVAPL